MTKTLSKRFDKETVKNGLHATRIDISGKNRVQLIALLNESLADTFDLFSQVKQAHWNVKGHQFYQLHLLFDQIAGELLEYGDELAERITALGGTALGTVRMAAGTSTLPEYPTDILDGMDHIEALADRFAPYCQTIRDNIDKATDYGDADTADLFTEISRNSDKRLWFLEAHLQAEDER
ncbi:MAG: DNA starvation/stationary phase protection protein Dps [Candidatus Obscuribacterales bacterium]|nr:DNA starvation/stationary phase protection protein Dps [Candidatus Obscuribacterales bacterium]